MAGHKAANAAPTWPDINGSFFPDTVFRDVPMLINFIENKITIHFVHRNLAYLIFILTLILTLKLYRITPVGRIFNRIKAIPAILIIFQLLLGIFSLVFSAGIQPNRWAAFEWMAQLHQITGMLFALSLIALLYMVRRRA
jgi:cytochrome c oxidase assembly protein subunit 15